MFFNDKVTIIVKATKKGEVIVCQIDRQFKGKNNIDHWKKSFLIAVKIDIKATLNLESAHPFCDVETKVN